MDHIDVSDKLSSQHWVGQKLPDNKVSVTFTGIAKISLDGTEGPNWKEAIVSFSVDYPDEIFPPPPPPVTYRLTGGKREYAVKLEQWSVFVVPVEMGGGAAAGHFGFAVDSFKLNYTEIPTRSVTIEADVSVLGTASSWSVAYQVTVLGEFVLREVVIPK